MIQAEDVLYYFNLGLGSTKKGQYKDAVNHFNKAIEINPDYPQIYYNLANAYNETNQYDLAVKNYIKATELDPNMHLAFNNLAITYAKLEKYDLAIENFKRAIALKPDHINAYNNLEMLYLNQGNHNQEVADLKNNYAEMYNKTGFAYANKQEYELAIEAYQKAIELNPRIIEAYNNLGVSYTVLKKYDLALENYNKAIELNPDFADSYSNIGVVYVEKQEYDKAISFYHKALELNPNNPDAHYNLGNSLMKKHQVDKAIKSYEKAIKLSPDAKKIFNLGLSYLVNKDFERGFKHYESRVNMDNYKKLNIPEFIQPKWTGDSLSGKTIFVYPEQGLGDSIQFSRYLFALKDMAKKVIFKPQQSLVKLFRQSDFPIEIADGSIAGNELEFDLCCSIMSLPHLLRADVSNIPCNFKYLYADADQVKAYKDKYFQNDLFKIGIKWQGNPLGDKNREASLENFYKLSGLPGIKLYSLQKYDGNEQLDNLPEGIEIIDLGNTFNDFSDTAAAIENLDLVITIDTSVAHLSAAMGKDTWILIPFVPEWRWFLDSDTTPWYNSARLFRQQQRDDWDEVFKKISEELINLA